MRTPPIRPPSPPWRLALDKGHGAATSHDCDITSGVLINNRVGRPGSGLGSAVEFNLADLFESVVDQVGDQTAMVSGLRRLSYTELDERADRLAHHLEVAGVRPGDTVGLQLANGTEYIEGMLACFKIRAVPINVNYRYLAGELEYLYRDAALVGLIFHHRFAPAVKGALRALPETRAVLEVCETVGDRPTVGEDYESALESEPDTREFPRAAATTSTASTRGARPACPKACSGGTTTSSSQPWEAVTRCPWATTSPRPPSLRCGSCTQASQRSQ